MKIHIKRKGWFRAKLVEQPTFVLILPVQFHPRTTWMDMHELTGGWESFAYVPAPRASRQEGVAL